MVLVFNALDQIIPQLGVFAPITTKLRNELFGIKVLINLSSSYCILNDIFSI